MELSENKDRCGLGYKVTKVDKIRIALEKKEKRLAHLENHDEDGEDDPKTPIKLRKLIKQESRIIHLHEEEIKIINLRTEDAKKEIKVGTTIKGSGRDKLVRLLLDYVDIFA
ncbi:hypothetical protein CR513_20913, partial [Mucuna pruriens]